MRQQWKTEGGVGIGRLFTVGLMICFVVYPATSRRIKDVYCDSEECKTTATKLSDEMDLDVNPCNNFYQFVCGGTLKKIITEYEDLYLTTKLSQLDDVVLEKLNKTLTEQSTDEEIKPFKSAKNFYQSCMNMDSLAERHDIAEEIGAWPAQTRDWNETIAWKQAIFKENSARFFYHHYNKEVNSTRIVLAIQSSLSIEEHANSLDLENISESKYIQLAINVSKILRPNEATAEKDILEVMQFEYELAKITDETKYNSIGIWDNGMTLDKLYEIYPNIPWEDYVNEKILKNITTLANDETIVIANPEYTAEIDRIIKETSTRVLTNYVNWRKIIHSIPNASDEKIKNLLPGSDEKIKLPITWQYCTQHVATSMPSVVAALYAKKNIDKETIQDVQDMYLAIRNQLKNFVQKVDWMESEAQEAAVDKLENLKGVIAVRKELMDESLLEKEFQDMGPIYSDDYHTNVKTLASYNLRRYLETLRKNGDENYDIMFISSIVSRLPWINSIMVPAGVLRSPFYNESRPKYMNYAAIGSQIGSHFVGAVHNIEIQVDENGRFLDRFGPNSKNKSLKRREACLLSQYSQHAVITRDAGQNLVDNIADIGGIKAAYSAYNEWAKANGPEPRLPGLDFTAKQLFWIAMANPWCEVTKPSVSKYATTLDSRVMHEFRVNLAVSNMPEFSKDFSCPFNPRKKCSIW